MTFTEIVRMAALGYVLGFMSGLVLNIIMLNRISKKRKKRKESRTQ